MDFMASMKAEMQRKRRKGIESGSSKYVKRGDILAKQEKEYLEKQKKKYGEQVAETDLTETARSESVRRPRRISDEIMVVGERRVLPNGSGVVSLNQILASPETIEEVPKTRAPEVELIDLTKSPSPISHPDRRPARALPTKSGAQLFPEPEADYGTPRKKTKIVRTSSGAGWISVEPSSEYVTPRSSSRLEEVPNTEDVARRVSVQSGETEDGNTSLQIRTPSTIDRYIRRAKSRSEYSTPSEKLDESKRDSSPRRLRSRQGTGNSTVSVETSTSDRRVPEKRPVRNCVNKIVEEKVPCLLPPAEVSSEEEIPLPRACDAIASSSIDIPPEVALEEPAEYEVEMVLARRRKAMANGKDYSNATTRKCYEYLVKWVGYSPDECTWEPPTNLEHSKDVLKNFYTRKLLRAAIAKRLPRHMRLLRPVDYTEGHIYEDHRQAWTLLEAEVKWNQELEKAGHAPIYIEDWSGSAALPKGFTFTTSMRLSQTVQSVFNALESFPAVANACQCTEGCGSVKGCCGKALQSMEFVYIYLTYNIYGRLRADKLREHHPEQKLVIECGSFCECDPNSCKQRVVQAGRKVPLVLFHEAEKGWGLRTAQDIKAGTFVSEYIGEVLTTEECSELRRSVTYQFSYQDIVPGQTEPFILDATKVGNECRKYWKVRQQMRRNMMCNCPHHSDWIGTTLWRKREGSEKVDYLLNPLMKSLDSRICNNDIRHHLAKICRLQIIDRNYLLANNAYMEMAIGNAPGPVGVGVTRLGIHHRPGSAKSYVSCTRTQR